MVSSHRRSLDYLDLTELGVEGSRVERVVSRALLRGAVVVVSAYIWCPSPSIFILCMSIMEYGILFWCTRALLWYCRQCRPLSL